MKNHTYEFLICDGNAAASREGEPDNYFDVEIKAPTLKDALQQTWNHLFYGGDSFEAFCEEYLEEEDEVDDPRDWSEEELLDFIDDQDISGGDPWLEAYMIDGKMIREPNTEYMVDDDGYLPANFSDVSDLEKWGLSDLEDEDEDDEDWEDEDF